MDDSELLPYTLSTAIDLAPYHKRELHCWQFWKFVAERTWWHPYNRDFSIVEGTQPIKDGRERAVHVCYKGTGLALFRLAFEPSEKAIAEGKVRIDYPERPEQHSTPIGHIEIYGYMAEFDRLMRLAIGVHQMPPWKPDWTPEMTVDIHSNL
jgi:hypothetical protein